MELSDADLVKRCLRGDNCAYDTLVKRYQKQVYSLCYRMVGDADDAADVTQDCFVKAYNALGSFRQDAKFLTWMFGIANNACIDLSRRRKTRRAASLDEMEEEIGYLPSSDPTPHSEVMRAEDERLLMDAVMHLPENYRAPLVMFHLNDMSIRDISTALGKPEGTIKSNLHTAREMLRQRLEGVVV